jgi:hypothetical protein
MDEDKQAYWSGFLCGGALVLIIGMAITFWIVFGS